MATISLSYRNPVNDLRHERVNDFFDFRPGFLRKERK